MANNYTLSSFELRKLTDDEKSWLEALEALAEKTSENWDISEYDNEWREFLGHDDDYDSDFDWGWEFEWHNDLLIVYAEESAGLHILPLAMQMFLRKFRPTQSLWIKWANTCSKMRPGEFDGGAIFITAHGETYTHVDIWLDAQQKKFDTLMAWMGDKYA